MQNLMTLKESAEYLSLKIGSIYILVKNGRVECDATWLARGIKLISVESLDNYKSTRVGGENRKGHPSWSDERKESYKEKIRKTKGLPGSINVIV